MADFVEVFMSGVGSHQGLIVGLEKGIYFFFHTTKVVIISLPKNLISFYFLPTLKTHPPNQLTCPHPSPTQNTLSERNIRMSEKIFLISESFFRTSEKFFQTSESIFQTSESIFLTSESFCLTSENVFLTSESFILTSENVFHISEKFFQTSENVLF